jgi:hypothetical protein
VVVSQREGSCAKRNDAGHEKMHETNNQLIFVFVMLKLSNYWR